MMVEASGTEKAWSYYEAGAPHVTEEVIADGLEAAKGWIRESIELQRQLVEKAGTHDPIPYVPQVDYGDDVWEKVDEVGADRVAHVTTITQKAERNAATDEATAGDRRRAGRRPSRVASGRSRRRCGRSSSSMRPRSASPTRASAWTAGA